jgi:SpoVK/Ycf46/Vps4 family AAA+-type ATPase
MLLYGPPGTGKTKIAKRIADVLDFRLVTISVSDFLGTGGALVEARAKAIFQMLEAQSNCVILFDEIDAFLLDRDSKHYRKQDTLFQFLTPGMLTKINDLHEAARSIFIIATNYENRIDPAIKRAGRIDQQYLLLPPDLKKRRAIIEKVVSRTSIAPAPTAGDFDEMARVSLYLGRKEIENAIEKSTASSAATIIDVLVKTQRTTGHQYYLARLTQETTFPNNEFIAIAKMTSEAGKASDVRNEIESLSGKAKQAWEGALNKCPDLKTELSRVGILS